MPTYEYLCSSCALRVDVLHGIYVDGPTTCEVCGGTLRKAISAAAVVFKGSGWAKKDAARVAARPASEKGSSEGSSPDSDGAKDAAAPVTASDKDTGGPSTPAERSPPPSKPAPKDAAGAGAGQDSSKGVSEKGSTSSRRTD